MLLAWLHHHRCRSEVFSQQWMIVGTEFSLRTKWVLPCKDSGYRCFLHPHQNHSRDGGDLLCCTEDATSHGPACASIPPKLRLGRGRRSSIVPATSKWPLRIKSRRKGFLKRGENHTSFFCVEVFSVERCFEPMAWAPQRWRDGDLWRLHWWHSAVQGPCTSHWPDLEQQRENRGDWKNSFAIVIYQWFTAFS